MTLSMPERDAPDQKSFTNYEALYQHSQTEGRPLALQDYAETAGQIAATRAYYRHKQAPPTESLAMLHELYVDGETDERKRRFATTLVDAPVQAWQQGRLRLLQSNPDSLPAEQRRSAVKDLKRRCCEYNHTVRDTILDGRGTFDRHTLTVWMAEAADNRYPRWARDQIAGATAETAFYEALLLEAPEVSSVTFTDVDEDLHGADIKARYGQVQLRFDTKFGQRKLEQKIRTVTEQAR